MLHEIYYAPSYFPHNLKLPSQLDDLVVQQIDVCVHNLLDTYCTINEVMEDESVEIMQQEQLDSFTLYGEKMYVN